MLAEQFISAIPGLQAFMLMFRRVADQRKFAVK